MLSDDDVFEMGLDKETGRRLKNNDKARISVIKIEFLLLVRLCKDDDLLCCDDRLLSAASAVDVTWFSAVRWRRRRRRS